MGQLNPLICFFFLHAPSCHHRKLRILLYNHNLGLLSASTVPSPLTSVSLVVTLYKSCFEFLFLILYFMML